jgi:hypothetical protein
MLLVDVSLIVVERQVLVVARHRLALAGAEEAA